MSWDFDEICTCVNFIQIAWRTTELLTIDVWMIFCDVNIYLTPTEVPDNWTYDMKPKLIIQIVRWQMPELWIFQVWMIFQCVSVYLIGTVHCTADMEAKTVKNALTLHVNCSACRHVTDLFVLGGVGSILIISFQCCQLTMLSNLQLSSMSAGLAICIWSSLFHNFWCWTIKRLCKHFFFSLKKYLLCFEISWYTQ